MSSSTSTSTVEPSITSNPSSSLLSNVTISPVSLRTLTGSCNAPLNVRALEWSARCGLMAYGCRGMVVVVDPETLQIVQVRGIEKVKGIGSKTWV